MKITIYTDGACIPNPGTGGYGVLLKYQDHEKKLSQGFLRTTNNRMELRAVIAGLEALNKEGLNVTIISDSTYVVDSLSKGWVFKWVKNKNSGKKNLDLWRRLLISYRKHKVEMKWVRGHNGTQGNEICDQLANQAIYSDNLIHDEGFSE